MLTELKRIVQELNRIPALDDALDWLAKRLTQLLEVDCCTVFLADYEQQHFVLQATEGLAKDAIGEVTVGFSEGLIGLIGQREEPLNLTDAKNHPRFKAYPEVHEEDYHAFLGAPIIHQRKVLGVVTLQQRHARRFEEDEEALLVTLATQIALAVAHAETRGQLSLNESASKSQWHRSLRGIAGSPGLAVGKGCSMGSDVKIQEQLLRRTTQSGAEIFAFRSAVKHTREDVERLATSVEKQVPADVLEIFQLYHHLLDANSLGEAVEEKIKAGWTAVSALKMVVEHYVTQFQTMADSYMQERAVDVEDLGNRVLGHLLDTQQRTKQVPDNAILVAEEVTAAMLAEFPHEQLVGVISMKGSNNSHAAILARAMGVPAIMGLSGVVPTLLDKREILMDGYSGEVVVDPAQSIRDSFLLLVQEEKELMGTIGEQINEPTETLDGCEVQLLINAGLSSEMESSHSVAGEGVGLYRTEVPFMMKDRFPSEQEQFRLYRSMLEAYPDVTVTMRTLDVGGDKPLPYFPLQEDNPFLGWRGIRMTLDHPEIFLVQVRAMLRANMGLGNLAIMLPMISSIGEVKEARRLFHQAYYEVRQEAEQQGIMLQMPKLGVMIEVPGILYQLRYLASEVDFFSVGSNDLTQYLLAVDRNNTRVADLYDSYHPSVLHALQHIANEAEACEIPVSVCGELAGEPGGALLLMAMGYRALSMNSCNLLKVKWVIRSVALREAETLLEQVLSTTDPHLVRTEVNMALEMHGLGGLVRAGK